MNSPKFSINDPCDSSETTILGLGNKITESLHLFATLTEKYLNLLTSPVSPNEHIDIEFKQTLEQLIRLDQYIVVQVAKLNFFLAITGQISELQIEIEKRQTKITNIENLVFETEEKLQKVVYLDKIGS